MFHICVYVYVRVCVCVRACSFTHVLTCVHVCTHCYIYDHSHYSLRFLYPPFNWMCSLRPQQNTASFPRSVVAASVANKPRRKHSNVCDGLHMSYCWLPSQSCAHWTQVIKTSSGWVSFPLPIQAFLTPSDSYLGRKFIGLSQCYSLWSPRVIITVIHF